MVYVRYRTVYSTGIHLLSSMHHLCFSSVVDSDLNVSYSDAVPGRQKKAFIKENEKFQCFEELNFLSKWLTVFSWN
jgi:hypothetical protein